jgi:hypothetical protein
MVQGVGAIQAGLAGHGDRTLPSRRFRSNPKEPTLPGSPAL